MVLGGSDDGGYYLIGVKHLHHRLFEQIDWSTERVFEQTLERAREIGLTGRTASHLVRRGRRSHSRSAATGTHRSIGRTAYDAKHTRAYLESLQVAPGSFTASSAC